METTLLLADGSTVRVGQVVKVMSADGRRVICIGAVEAVSPLGLARVYRHTGYVLPSRIRPLKGDMN